ncbi:MAG: hypothetical protein QOJ15_10728 [Bradyrhizobium sp.]|jgi:hypothetical protein|nr:hypothetical protein [Bradyrhizobium sp.]
MMLINIDASRPRSSSAACSRLVHGCQMTGGKGGNPFPEPL